MSAYPLFEDSAHLHGFMSHVFTFLPAFTTAEPDTLEKDLFLFCVMHQQHNLST